MFPIVCLHPDKKILKFLFFLPFSCASVSGKDGGKGQRQNRNTSDWYQCQCLAIRSHSLSAGLGTTVGFPRLSEAFAVAHSLKEDLVAQLL